MAKQRLVVRERWLLGLFVLASLVSCSKRDDHTQQPEESTAVVEEVDTRGFLDEEFGDNGIVTTSVGGETWSDFVNAVAVLPDGKIIVAGYTYDYLFPDNDALFLVRYNADGLLDPSFDEDGKVVTSVAPEQEQWCAMAIQADGGILVAGRVNVKETSTGEYRMHAALVRYNSDGSLDTTFGPPDSIGGGGKVILALQDTFAHSVVLQMDGKVVVAGDVGKEGEPPNSFFVARYHPDGSLDTTFNGTGVVVTDMTSGGKEVWVWAMERRAALAIQPDGKILVAGSAYNNGYNNGPEPDFAVVRYHPDGSLDTTFGADGRVTTPISLDLGSYATAMSLQPDGKFFVVGYYITVSSDDAWYGTNIAVVHYNPDGSLDPHWGADGIVTLSTMPEDDEGGGWDKAYAVAIQENGKPVVVGTGPNGAGRYCFLVSRYAVNGSLDPSFGSFGVGGGVVLTDIGGDPDLAFLNRAKAVAMQSDHKIVVAGHFSNNFPYGQNVAVARYR